MVRVTILPVVAAVALVTVGCGGGGAGKSASKPPGVQPRTWVASVCGALHTWQGSLQTKARALPQDVIQAQSPEAAKKQIGTFLDEVLAETDTMIASVGTAGTPAVARGKQISVEFRAGLERMRAAFERARTKVSKVSTSNPLAFQQQLTSIGEDLQTQGKVIADMLGNIDKKFNAKEIGTAFRQNRNCAAFTG